MSSFVEQKLEALQSVLDDSYYRIKCLHDEEGFVFAAVKAPHQCPVFVIFTEAEHKAEHPENLERILQAYRGHKEIEYQGRRYHFYSGYFAN